MPGGSRVYLSTRISCDYINGVKWYSKDQERDIRDFLESEGMVGVRTVGAPMPSRDELIQCLIKKQHPKSDHKLAHYLTLQPKADQI